MAKHHPKPTDISAFETLPPGDCILRFDEVKQKTGLCRAHVHALAMQGKFPKPIKLVPGGRASGWLLSEIDQWIADRVADRNRGGENKKLLIQKVEE